MFTGEYLEDGAHRVRVTFEADEDRQEEVEVAVGGMFEDPAGDWS